MNCIEMLKETAEKNKSIVCMGADPVIEKIEMVVQGNNIEEKIVKFYFEIIDACIAENTLIGAIKPNYAFYAQYGFEGLRALKKICEKVKKENIPLILDAKRGDIGRTAEAYAKEVYDFWEADCATVSPYMGFDTIEPFIKYCKEKGKGIYLLNRTSNPGASEFQNLLVDGKPLYHLISEKIIEWGKNSFGNVGAVVGAPSTTEFKEISDFFSGKKVPFLIPGVGKQGGSAEEISRILKETKQELSIHRINSSSEINYAFEKQNTTDYAGAAIKTIKELNRQINF